MICIKSIEVLEVERKDVEVAHFKWPDGYFETGDYECSTMTAELTYEMVRGRVFRNANGQEVCIGMTKQVQDAVGLPFEAFENMEKEISNLYEEVGNLRLAISMLRGTGFWGRLRWLFGGLKYVKYGGVFVECFTGEKNEEE